MGVQVLIIPALFVAICVSFILLHSCYYRWKIGNAFRRKREAAKISLVNILQMTNPSLITPSWISGSGSSLGKGKSGKASVSWQASTQKSPAAIVAFDPRNPKVLSSDARLADDSPPPYEDLFGYQDADFVTSLEDNGTLSRGDVYSTSNTNSKKGISNSNSSGRHCALCNCPQSQNKGVHWTDSYESYERF